ncbi:MAG: hypothetical protein AAFO75_07110, partial [Pseudomonadota bacterium]
VRTGLSMALVAGVVAATLVPVAAQAQSSCKWYGATALKQQKKNEQLGCKFSGPQWHSDLGGHMAWCSSQPPDVWKASARNRDKMLADCAAK